MATNSRPKQQEDEATNIIKLADVHSEEVDWLWYPYIPIGKLTGLEGDPGIGKSTVGLAIATDVSVGQGLPGAPEMEPANVLIASAEDGLSDTIKPRLERMQADTTRIHAIQGSLNFASRGISKLKGYIELVSPILVIIDPLVAYIGANVDIYRANETREILSRLTDVAEEYFLSILIIRHLTKAYHTKAIYRGQGNIDITAACRSVLLAGCNPQDNNDRALFHIKSNLAPQGAPVGYRIEEGKLIWTGESRLTLTQVLSSGPEEDKLAIDEAIAFLKDELSDGPVDAAQVFTDAKNLQISEKTLRRAKAKLDIVSRREGESGKRGGGRFSWKLPENEPNDLDGQISIYGHLDHVNNFSLNNTKSHEILGHLNNDNHKKEFVE